MTTTERYADAVVALARAQDALETVEEELLTITRALEDNAGLRERLDDDTVPVGRRLGLVESGALTAAHPATRSVLAALITAGQTAELQQIATGVAERAAAERDRELAEVHVAVPLDDERRRRLRRALERATGKQLELQVIVDEDVVGGVRAKIGDTVIDGSVARRLQRAHARVSGASTQ